MNTNGKQIIEAIVNRLDDEDVRCYDSAIVAKLRTLNRYEIQQLSTFGDTTEWHNERIKKLNQ